VASIHIVRTLAYYALVVVVVGGAGFLAQMWQPAED
jgi:hypothetical protein